MKKLSLKYLDWDSHQLGVRCGLIDGTKLELPTHPLVLIKQIKTLCEKKGDLEFITIKLPSKYHEAVNQLVKMGASLIDIELTFVYFGTTASKDYKPISNNLKFVFCKKCDSKVFIPLAEEMHLSRFFLDLNISKDKAIHLWKTSIKNHCEGFADRLLIATYNNEPCGMVTLEFKGNNKIRLHMVGVLRDYRRKNIAKGMLKSISERYSRDYSIHVETQSDNIVAQRLYQVAGFRLDSLKYILHYWR